MALSVITIIGLVAAFCTTVSFLPQVVKTIRTRHLRNRKRFWTKQRSELLS